MKTVRIFYRNRPGKDTKVMGWETNLSLPVLFKGVPLTDPSNAFIAVAEISLEDSDISYQQTDSYGAFVKKVQDGALADRATLDIEKDIARRPFYIENCEAQIALSLQGKLKETWLMIGAYNLLIYLRSLQQVLNIEDSSLSVAGQQAKATLAYIEQNIVFPSNTAMTSRDNFLAALDQED